MNRSLSPLSRRLLATILAAVCVLSGAVHLSKWSSGQRQWVDTRVAYWQWLLTGLDQNMQQDQSFRAAYSMLLQGLNMAETVEIWQEVDSRVDLTPEIRARLESAYMAAAVRARSSVEVRRLEQLKVRYRHTLEKLDLAAASSTSRGSI